MIRLQAAYCNVLLVLVCAHSITPDAAQAVEVQPGFIVAPQSDNNGTIVVIDPATGNREILSLYPNIGSGPRMRRPSGIVELPDGDFLVTESFTTRGLFRIDRETGDRTFISGEGLGSQGDPTSIGTGPVDNPNSVLLRSNNDIILVNQGGFNFTTGFITKVDPVNGNRTLVSGLGVGTGPVFSDLRGGAIAADGRLMVAGETSIFAVDMTTGARSVISGSGVGTGPNLAGTSDLVVLPNGNLIVSDFGSIGTAMARSALFQINASTGNRTILEQHLFPDSIPFDYQRLALGYNGNLLGSPVEAVYSVNPVNASRTLISGAARGTGQALFWGDMVIVTVPEPGSCVLTLLLVALVSQCRCASRRRK